MQSHSLNAGTHTGITISIVGDKGPLNKIPFLSTHEHS